MQITITQPLGKTLEEWAKVRGISIRDLAVELLSRSCKDFLDGKIAGLQKSAQLNALK